MSNDGNSITLAGHTWYRDDLHRAALTRALTAQAWAVMVVWVEFFRVNGIEPQPDAKFEDFAYPAPADLAEEMLR